MPRARNPDAAVVFVPGQLSYLPKRPDDELLLLADSEVPKGCFDHPVVILSTDRRKKEAVVLILTSMGGKSLDEYSPRTSTRSFYLPIHPSPVHPDNGILLFLDQDVELPKKTYVNTKSQRSIPWAWLQRDYREQRTRKQCRLRPDSLAEMLDYIGLDAPVGHGKSKAPKTPRYFLVDHPSGRDLLESMRADNLAQYGSFNQPTVPQPSTLKPPKHSVRAPVAAPTLQSMARSRESAAAEADRAQRREARMREARSILPIYSSTSRSDNVGYSDNSLSIMRKLFVLLFVIAGIFLTVAWWRCQLSECK